MKAEALIAAVLVALPAAAGEGYSLGVAELRSRLPTDDRASIDGAALAGQVRDVARRTLPEAEVLDDSAASADLAVSGEVLRIEQGFLVSLELRESRSNRLLGTASSAASTPEEVGDAVASASVDLFRAYKAAATLAMTPAAVPDAPQAFRPIGPLTLAADANVLVAYDEARTADARGKDRPDEAASAWRWVAEMGGENPFREAAAVRAGQWQGYADGMRAFEAQLVKDTSRLRKVLKLASVTDPTKIELLVRYTRAYGPEKARPLIALLPRESRANADLSVSCEARQSAACVALAHAADQANDARGALDYFDRACSVSDADACAEAGDRFLRVETRDVARAIPALQGGCAAGGAKACVRLARVYEEGDGTAPDVAAAADLRDKACTAGDGKSCRKLACSESGDDPASQARAAAFWDRGCKDGDSISCALLQVSNAPAVKPAAAPVAAAVLQPQPKPKNHRAAGASLLAISLIVGGGAVFIASAPDVRDGHWYGRNYLRETGGGPSKNQVAAIFGVTAAIAGVTGIGLMLWHPDPEQPKVAVGLAPTGLVVSGSLP